MTEAWKTGRIVLGVSLLALVVFGPLGDVDGGAPIRVTSATALDDLARAFALDGSVGAVYSDSVPPSPTVSALLSGAAARNAPVRLTVPGRLPEIVVTPPVAPVAMRRAALDVALRGTPATDVPVTIEGPAGRVDSMDIRLDSNGHGHAAVAVEAASEGETTWTVRAGGSTVTTTRWVRPAAAVRVLILTGAPGWEARYLARALEAAGVDVAVHQALGRDRIVASSGATLPTTLADLEKWDVVALVDPPESTPSGLLLDWMTQEGGGLLLLGSGVFGAELAPWSPAGPLREVAASSLSWAGPAEIVPLPSAEIVSRTAPVGGGTRTPVATEAGASAEGSPARSADVVTGVDWAGRGRIFTSGLESWRWAMEAGLTTEHQAYWESVVEWLAGGLTADFSLTGSPGTAMVAWEGRIEGAVPPGLVLQRPADAELARSDLLVVGRTGTSGRIRFVPRTTGEHLLGDAHDGVVVPMTSTPLPWSTAALEVGGHGGDIRPAGPTAGPDGTPLRNPLTRLWLLFLALGGVAVANWATRRASGLA